MPNIRIKDIPTTASATVNGDFFAVDSSASTRKLNAFSPTFGGNATVAGTLTVNGTGTNSIPNLSVTGIGGLNVSANFLTSANTLRFSDSAAGGQTWFMSPQLGDGVATNFAFYSNDGVTSTPLFRVSSAGVFRLPSTTASTSTSSGALVIGNGTSGGLGVGGAITCGGGVTATGTVYSAAALSTAGGLIAQNGDITGGYIILRGFGNQDGGVLFLGQSANNNYVSSNATTIGITIGNVGITSAVAAGFRVLTNTASTTTSTGALVVSGGVGVAGNTNIGGVVSVGGSSNAAVGVYVINTALTGVDQYGVASEPIWTSAAVSGHTIWARTKTAASAFTLTNGTAIYVEQPTLGSGSSITNNYGLRITNQGAAGVANAYGVDILAQSGASSTNVGLRNAGTTLLTNSTASTSTSNGALVVSGGMGIAKQIVAGGVISIDPLDASPEDLAPEVAFCRGVSLATTASVLAFGSGARIGLLRGYQDGGNLVEWRFGSYIGTTFNEQMRLGGTSATSSSLTLYGTTASTSTASGALVVSGGVGVAKQLYVGGNVNSAGDLTVEKTEPIVSLKRAANTNLNLINLWTGAAADFGIGLRNTTDSDLHIYNYGTSNDALKIAKADSLATFGGAVRTAAPSGGTAANWKLGTVATVSPTSPNRTIEVDIGGTIYYIHAKTTNN